MARPRSFIYFKFLFFFFFWKLNAGTIISHKFYVFLIFTWAWCFFNFLLSNSRFFSWQNNSFLDIINKIFFSSVSSRPWSYINFFLKKSWLIHFQSRSWSIFCKIKFLILNVMSRSWSHLNNLLFWLTTKYWSFQIIGLIHILKQLFVLVLAWSR